MASAYGDTSKISFGSIPAVGEAVTIGIRPEKLRLGDGKTPVRFNGTVRLTEHLGRETVVYVDGGPLVTTGSDSGTTVFTVQLADVKHFPSGSPVSVGFDPVDAYLFAADGRTISPPKVVEKI